MNIYTDEDMLMFLKNYAVKINVHRNKFLKIYKLLNDRLHCISNLSNEIIDFSGIIFDDICKSLLHRIKELQEICESPSMGWGNHFCFVHWKKYLDNLINMKIIKQNEIKHIAEMRLIFSDKPTTIILLKEDELDADEEQDNLIFAIHEKQCFLWEWCSFTTSINTKNLNHVKICYENSDDY